MTIMNDEIPMEWRALYPNEKKEIIDLLKRVGIAGVRVLLDDPRPKPLSRGR